MPVQRHGLGKARLRRQRIPRRRQRAEGIAPCLPQGGDGQRPKGRNTDLDEQGGADGDRHAEAGDALQKRRKGIADDEDLQQLIGGGLLDGGADDPECAGLPHDVIHQDSRPDDNDDAERAPCALDRTDQHLQRVGAEGSQGDDDIHNDRNDRRPADAPFAAHQQNDEQQHRRRRQQAQQDGA